MFLACLSVVIVEASPFSTIEAKNFHVILYKVHTIKTIKFFVPPIFPTDNNCGIINCKLSLYV